MAVVGRGSRGLLLRASSPALLRPGLARGASAISLITLPSSLLSTSPPFSRPSSSAVVQTSTILPSSTRRSAATASVDLNRPFQLSARSRPLPSSLLRRRINSTTSPRRYQSTALPTTSSNQTTSTSKPTSQSTRPNSTLKRTPFILRLALNTSLFALFSAFGFFMAAAPAAESLNGWLNPPSDAETLAMISPSTPTSQSLESHLNSLPLITTLRSNPDLTESRPHMKIAPGMRSNSLTAGLLMNDTALGVPPVNFASVPSTPLPTLTQILYLGPGVCGHPGIVHGGMLATILDEGLARCCFPALPNKIGVTANLKIEYRAPCPADSWVVLKAETVKVEGRKVWVKGWMEVLDSEGKAGDGTRIVEAEALFIEPRHAKNMARLVGSQS